MRRLCMPSSEVDPRHVPYRYVHRNDPLLRQKKKLTAGRPRAETHLLQQIHHRMDYSLSSRKLPTQCSQLDIQLAHPQLLDPEGQRRLHSLQSHLCGGICPFIGLPNSDDSSLPLLLPGYAPD